MKKILMILVCTILLAGCDSSDSDQAKNNKQTDSGENTAQKASDSDNSSKNSGAGQFESKNARQSYALGMNIANSLQKMPIDVDIDKLATGINDKLGSDDAKLTDKQVRSEMSELVKQMRSKEEEEQKEKAAANLEKSQKFLKDNKSKDGVKTTDNGLQYKVVKEGKGPSPDTSDKVTVTYEGKLASGEVFDSTEKHGEPATFPVDAVIPGWTEGLQMMHEGAEYKLFIPPDLAYGKRGSGQDVGPNQVLIFDVTLKSVTSAQDDADSSKGSGADSDSVSENTQ